MRKLLILILLSLSLGLSGQMIGIMASQGGNAGCGTGTSNYGTTSTAGSDGHLATYIYYIEAVTIVNCGTVTSISLYIGATAAATAKVAIYTNGGDDKPLTLLTNGVSDEIVESANGWNTYTFSTPPTVTSNTVYWIASHSSATHTNGASTGTSTAYAQLRSYASGFPATATPGAYDTSYTPNAYATVTH